MTAPPSPESIGLSWRTAGESHGPAMLGFLEGLPAGLPLDFAAVEAGLVRRWKGPGRGPRSKFEQDALEWVSGLKKGITLGTPLSILVRNSDTKIDTLPDLKAPRPGHADLPGVIRHQVRDVRAVLERASARETVARTALGEVARQLLAAFGVQVQSQVISIKGVTLESSWEEIIQEALDDGESLGGTFQVIANGLPPGLGGYAQATDRLDARLMGALASIPAIKGVEIGQGFAASETVGSAFHDEVCVDSTAYHSLGRVTNHAGGVEGGLTNGQQVLLRAAMKPIPTLRKGVPSVDLETGKLARSTYERSDVCAVFAAAVVGEALVSLELASALRARLGGTTLREMQQRFETLNPGASVTDWPQNLGSSGFS